MNQPHEPLSIPRSFLGAVPESAGYVWLALSCFADESMVARVTVPVVAELLGRSNRHVERQIATLKAKGVVARVRNQWHLRREPQDLPQPSPARPPDVRKLARLAARINRNRTAR